MVFILRKIVANVFRQFDILIFDINFLPVKVSRTFVLKGSLEKNSSLLGRPIQQKGVRVASLDLYVYTAFA